MYYRTTGLTIALMVSVVGFTLQGCTSSTAAGEPVAKACSPAAKTMPCPMHGTMGKEQMMCTCPMCQMMMRPIIIATSDGGVVVMMGDKLMKFDRELNLVKETKIKMDIEGMGKRPGQPMKECPVKKSMMKERCPMKKESEN
jgi:hypothetical protein